MSIPSLSNPHGPASDRQRAYLAELIQRAHVSPGDLQGLTGVMCAEELTKAQAHELIDLLLPENKGELHRRLAEIRGQLPLMGG